MQFIGLMKRKDNLKRFGDESVGNLDRALDSGFGPVACMVVESFLLKQNEKSKVSLVLPA